MLLEALPGDIVRFAFVLTDAESGIGITGLTPTIVLRRRRDGMYLQSNSTFGGSAALLAMVEASATDHPGLYYFDFDHTLDGQQDTYTAYLSNASPMAAALQAESVKTQIGFTPGSLRHAYFFVSTDASPLGVAGLSPEVSLQRITDGLYLNASKTAFDSASVVFHNMAELDAANQPGVYEFTLDQSIDPVPQRYMAYYRVDLGGGTFAADQEIIEFIGRDELPLPVGGLVFAGIAGLVSTGLGSLDVSAIAASGVIVPPLRYHLYIAPSEDIEADPPGLLFQSANLLGEFPGPRGLIFTEADRITTLSPLQEYSVGMKVMDGRQTEDANTVILTAEVRGSSKTVVSIASLVGARDVK